MLAEKLKLPACFIAALVACTTTCAETTYRWVDPLTGTTVLSDLPPPPGAKQVSRITTTSGQSSERPIPYAVRRASEKYPVVLYTPVNCAVGCSEGRSLLDGRGVPFTEKVLNNAAELAELTRELGKEVSIPAIQVGRQHEMGFDKASWNTLLDAAGYPEAASAAGQRPAKAER